MLVTLAVALALRPCFPAPLTRASAHALPAMIRRNAPDAILVATPRRGKPLVLRNRPIGRALAVLRRHTELGSPVKLGIAVTRGNWIAVISERLPNGVLGWVPANA